MKNDLRLHEELLLLGLHDRTGKLTASMATYAMAGGLLAELLLGDRIAVARGKRPLVDVRSRTRFGVRALDGALGRIARAKRRAVLSTWVARLARDKELLRQTTAALCDRGILRAEEVRVLLVFRSKRYPERDHGPERAVLDRIEAALAVRGPEVDARTVALVALAYHADVLAAIYPRKWLKQRKARVEALIEGSSVGAAVRKAVDGVKAATAAMVAGGAVVTS